MKVYLLDKSELLDEVADYWKAESNGNIFGMQVEKGCFLEDIQKMIDGEDSAIFVLVDEKIVGFMGVRIFNSPLSSQRIANEHYWYVIPERRGIGSIRLIKEVIKWSKEQGCSHILLNASMLASDLHDKVCSLYEKLGAKKFGTTYSLGV